MLFLFLKEGGRPFEDEDSKGPLAALLAKGELVGAKPEKIDICVVGDGRHVLDRSEVEGRNGGEQPSRRLSYHTDFSNFTGRQSLPQPDHQ